MLLIFSQKAKRAAGVSVNVIMFAAYLHVPIATEVQNRSQYLTTLQSLNLIIMVCHYLNLHHIHTLACDCAEIKIAISGGYEEFGVPISAGPLVVRSCSRGPGSSRGPIRFRRRYNMTPGCWGTVQLRKKATNSATFWDIAFTLEQKLLLRFGKKLSG